MKTQEFTTGNIIWCNGVYHKIISIHAEYDFSKINKDFIKVSASINSVPIIQIKGESIVVHHGDIDKIEPVQITEEILLKSGFDDQKTIEVSNSIVLALDQDGDLFNVFLHQTNSEGEEDVILLNEPLQYLHQLQNLFYALKGEELEINL